jgi:prepilin-type N-terminal cleavage/methylation domain-containing protein
MRVLMHGTRRPRAAFTLLELIVVLAIMAVLVALVAAAVMRVVTVQQSGATDSTLEKVASELNKQWKVVIQQAEKEAIPASVVQLAGGDTRRARVIWIKLRLKQEFPVSYFEAVNPGWYLDTTKNPPVPVQVLPTADLPPKNIYVKNLPAASKDATTESSACLLLALTQGRGGMTWDAEGTIGAGSIRDTDGDGAREITDAWGKAIYYVRYPIPNANLNLPGNQNPVWAVDLNSGGFKAGNNDPQDPDGVLNDPSWAPGNLGTTFGLLCHPVASKQSWQNLSPFVASAGPNRAIDDNDDRFSYRLKSMGAGGQR